MKADVEPGRAHLAAFNPGTLQEVEVDRSRLLTPGTKFRVVSARDYFGSPLVTGVYRSEAVRVRMKSIAEPKPAGMAVAEFLITEPRFAAFVVVPETF